MNEVIKWIEPFAYGFIVGYFWPPFWKIAKKICYEAKLASQEWKKPNG